MRMKLVPIAAALAACLLLMPSARADETVTVDGIPCVLIKPPAAPVGSLVLMAGGDGRIGVGPGGTVSRGGNQLVRTRADYAARGFAVLVPDAGIDVAAAVKYMAAIKRPVTLVGTSRGTQRAAEGIAAGARPDRLVLTSGFLSAQSGEGVDRSVIVLLGSPSLLPRTLVIEHRHDECRFTSPQGVAPFLAWSRGKARVVWLDGGDSAGNPCEARGHHGFYGQDAQVVGAVAAFARR
ncbi:MAG TPA: alpha/beta hydrolase [Pseudolabrys sp.]|nr:alpha/beta hydrolase [Pseudolabrys sp.]